MPSQIELEFRRRCPENTSYELLLGQWEYEKRLAQRALALIGRTFPHYSLHDASHSETILLRIGAILGPRTTQLSVTDLWLLLHCAYLHDAGMVALHARRKHDLDSEDFRHFVERSADTGSDLSGPARRLLEHRIDTLNDLDRIAEDLTLLYAEFVRPTHAERSAKAVLDPHVYLGVQPPRTLIPNRFWSLIARIVRAHGEDFSWILQNLPKEESGTGDDLCHPRFVACMIRLGDLLDLDSGRFCPALAKSIAELPKLSKTHQNKHEGVRRLLVTPYRIEVEGEYTDVDAYVAAEQWLTWLREELARQQASWDDIRPEAIEALPSCGTVRARLDGQVLLTPGQRPRFEIDRERLLNIVRGANLYNGPQDALREVVQNAIDATLLRYALESDGVSLPQHPEGLQQALANWPIDISLVKNADATVSSVQYKLTVSDQGIGMSRADLEYLLRVGGSRKNEQRERLRRRLPDWMRPSGTFGLGFHSLFEHSNHVTVWTRHVDGGQGYEIAFDRDNFDDILVTVREWNASRARGTRVECIFTFPSFPTRVSLNVVENSHELVEFDFVSQDHFPYEPVRMASRALELSDASPVPIVFRGIPIDRTHKAGISGWFFHTASGARVRLHYEKNRTPAHRSRARFRGAPVESDSQFQLIDVETDLWTGDAREHLQISRNKWTAAGQEAFDAASVSATQAALGNWIQILSQRRAGLEASSDRDHLDHQLQRLSLWARVTETTVDDVAVRDAWHQFTLNGKNGVQLSLREVVSANHIELQSVPLFGPASKYQPSIVRLCCLDTRTSIEMDHEPEWLDHLLSEELDPPSLLSLDDCRRPKYRYARGVPQTVETAALDELYWPIMRSFDIGCRDILPLFPGDDTSILQIPTSNRIFHGGRRHGFRQCRLMANPFTRDDRKMVVVVRLREYVQWLVRERQQASLDVSVQTTDQICRGLEYFIKAMVRRWSEHPHRVTEFNVNMDVITHHLNEIRSERS